MFIPATWKHPK